MTDEKTVTRNDDASRYEIRVGDRVAGFLEFRDRPDGVVDLPHTEVDREFSGHGIGSTLAQEALADLAQRGDTIAPSCPFIAHYLTEHEVPGLKVVDSPGPADEDAASAGEPA